MSEFDDIQTLHKTGYWPDQQVSEWASEANIRLHGPGVASSNVIEVGLTAEIKRLRKQLEAIPEILREVRDVVYWKNLSVRATLARVASRIATQLENNDQFDRRDFLRDCGII